PSRPYDDFLVDVVADVLEGLEVKAQAVLDNSVGAELGVEDSKTTDVGCERIEVRGSRESVVEEEVRRTVGWVRPFEEGRRIPHARHCRKHMIRGLGTEHRIGAAVFDPLLEFLTSRSRFGVGCLDVLQGQMEFALPL